MDQEHALIDDGPAGEGRDIGSDVALLKLPSDDIEQPVKVQPFCHLIRAPHKALHDIRLRFPRGLSQHLRADRDRPPSEKLHPVASDDDLQHFLRLQALQGLLRQEEHADAVASRRAQIVDSDLPRRLHHQPVGNLHHQPDAVSGFAAGVLAGAMLQFLHDLQRVVHGPVTLLAADADDRADPAGIVLHGRTVQGIVLLRLPHRCPPSVRSRNSERTAFRFRRQSFFKVQKHCLMLSQQQANEQYFILFHYHTKKVWYTSGGKENR